jgi:hypothetical protein
MAAAPIVASTTPTEPKRGGIHPLFELYLGGSPLDDEYRPIESNSYSYATQRRNIKTIASIERDLTSARHSTTTLKFDGKLEPVVGSTTEVGKERFLQLLERRVEEHGHETFYYVKYEGKVVNLFAHIHNVTLEALTKEFKTRMTPIADPAAPTPPPFSAFDKYERGDVTMSRLVTESFLTPAFYDKIFVRYGHLPDFKKLPGSCLLLMALETCNASASHDIDGAAQAFADLTLDTYPGENVAKMSNEGLRLIRIMKGGYALPVITGSRLLHKVARTLCEEFNRKVYNLLDKVKQMEHKYRVVDPRKILSDPNYDTLGPIGLIATLHEIYERLVTDHDWPALAAKLPQSNNASANSAVKPGDKSDIKCFRCKGNHHIKDCPKKTKHKDTGVDKDADEPAAKKVKTAVPAWRYVEPKNLTVALVDDNGKNWKFCTKCVCRHSGKTGLYLLSHFDSEHKADFVSPSNEGNLASVDVPLGIPAATTRDPTSVSSEEDEDPIEFQGAWCASVSNSAAAAAFLDSDVSIDDDYDDVEEVVDSEDDLPLLIPRPTVYAADDFVSDDLASLSSLSSIEREMFLQVERDLFPGSAMQAKVDPECHDTDELKVNPESHDTDDELTLFFFDWSLAPIALESSADATPLPSVFSTIATWMFPQLYHVQQLSPLPGVGWCFSLFAFGLHLPTLVL